MLEEMSHTGFPGWINSCQLDTRSEGLQRVRGHLAEVKRQAHCNLCRMNGNLISEVCRCSVSNLAITPTIQRTALLTDRKAWANATHQQ